MITWPEEAKLPPFVLLAFESFHSNYPINCLAFSSSIMFGQLKGLLGCPKMVIHLLAVFYCKTTLVSIEALRSSRPRSRPTATTVPLPVRPATTPLPPQPRPIFNKPLEPNPPQPNVPIPPVTQPTCGVAPDFTPCVSSEEASHALMDCCRRKNLPAGCLSLCRYDITQAEVRSAMDRGLCGIFSVAPYLECASQGKDNTECCRYKGLAQKTGPQCEQFCRPSYGLSALGLQHIVCGNAIGDMLHCHHAGIRR
ncbi:unnamed protein product [Haemonchus placei]|uniref:Domain of unknown function DB domain-containing protein n=1 Tax=Haemonchus placei TaxID=6290 RepID=A0A3P7VCD0_HAEPC|nr:unnamed protein product [Haemonchus placei]